MDTSDNVRRTNFNMPLRQYPTKSSLISGTNSHVESYIQQKKEEEKYKTSPKAPGVLQVQVLADNVFWPHCLCQYRGPVNLDGREDLREYGVTQANHSDSPS